MTTMMWVILGVGVFLGYFVGRTMAEMRAARFDMNQRWRRRTLYRDHD